MPFGQIIAPFFCLQDASDPLRLLTFTGKNYIIFLYAIFVYCGISAVMQYYFSKERMNYYEIHDW